jgi:hypothetical protein
VSCLGILTPGNRYIGANDWVVASKMTDRSDLR